MPQYPTTFPFLKLPCELQAEVVRHVGDIVALRDLLAIPQVVRSVAPFVRLVTNTDSPTWFTGLEKYTKQLDVEELAVGELNRNGPIYILDLLLTQSFSLLRYQGLRRPIAVLTLPDSPNRRCNESSEWLLSTLSNVMCAKTIALMKENGHNDAQMEPLTLPLGGNLTLGNFDTIDVADTLEDLRIYKPISPIKYVGSLDTLTLGGVPRGTCAEELRLVYHHFKELIDRAGNFEILPVPNYEALDDDYGDIMIDGWEIARVRKLYEFRNCRQFTNVKINTEYSHERTEGIEDALLSLDMTPLYMGQLDMSPEDDFYIPVIQNVEAPGLRRLHINASGTFFPLLKTLWFPQLEMLRLTGCRGGIGFRIEFDHLGIEEIQELSKLLFVVKELFVDQFIAPVLGMVLPSSLDNLTNLTLQDDGLGCYDTDKSYTGIELLKLRHGKIHLPKLKELLWSSRCPDDHMRVLDFEKLSKWFIMPRLKTLVFESMDTRVSLKEIALQTPRIKELEVKDTDYCYPLTDWKWRMYPPANYEVGHSTFHRLKNLVIRTGFHSHMFKGVSFPQLKRLDILMNPDMLADVSLCADMPVVETMLISTALQKHTSSQLHIGDFKNLKKLSLTSDVTVWSFGLSPKLEEITHTGKGLSSLIGPPTATMEKLKLLRYTSLNHRPCHDFTVTPSAYIDVR